MIAYDVNIRKLKEIKKHLIEFKVKMKKNVMYNKMFTIFTNMAVQYYLMVKLVSSLFY
jgi:hypothetical protein